MGLEELLDAHREGGDQGSEGVFTLDRELARRKLAESGLSEPDLGLLKLVQLGLSAGAQGVGLQLSADKVQLWVRRHSAGAFDLTSLDDPVRLALESCLHAGYLEGVASSCDATLDLTRERFECGPGNRALDRNCICFQFTREAKGGYLQRLRERLTGRAHGHALLYQRLRACPVPVQLDGRQINADAPWSSRHAVALGIKFRAPTALRPQAVWSRDKVPLSRSGYHRPPRSGEIFWENQCVAPFLAGNDRRGELSPILGHLWVPMRGKEGQLVFVDRGVVVGSCTPSLPLFGFVSAYGLDTDASGLNLVNNSKLEARVECIADALRTLVGQRSFEGVPPSVRRRLSSL